MKTPTSIALAVLTATFMDVFGQTTGGNFTLQGSAVSGGGGTSAGGAFTLTGFIGQPAAGSLSGGAYRMVGGIAGFYALPTVGGDAQLSIQQRDGKALLSWDLDGYVLETRSVFGPAEDWKAVTPAPDGRVHTTPLNQPARFFRLRRP